jgi:hypothetical protein
MKDELDKIEETVDKVLAPERAIRWGVRGVMFMVVFGALFVVGKALWHMNTKVDRAVQEVEAQEAAEAEAAAQAAEAAAIDHGWFVVKKDAIDACALEVKAARDSLARHQADADKRFVSRESDRQETARLNQAVTNAQVRRLNLIRDYNEKATRVTPTILGDLPAHIEVAELPVPQPEED